MFAAAHYAALAVFVLGCWGFGRALLVRLAPGTAPAMAPAKVSALTL